MPLATGVVPVGFLENGNLSIQILISAMLLLCVLTRLGSPKGMAYAEVLSSSRTLGMDNNWQRQAGAVEKGMSCQP